MDSAVLAQHVFNGLMLGVVYSMIGVGFSLFFGVLDVIKFSHGDVFTAGAYAGLGSAFLVGLLGSLPGQLPLAFALAGAIATAMLLGIVISRFLILPLRFTAPINVLLITLMAGTFVRECIRLFVPNGGNPKPFPVLLPSRTLSIGDFNVRTDSLLILGVGCAAIIATQLVLSRTRLGIAIRAVAQDADTAQLMGIDFRRVAMLTVAVGSGLAALAGVMTGMYYREITFNMGLLLGIIGFCAAVVGGLGSLWGALLGGFLFAGLQTVATVGLPFSSAYKDVFAFGVMILLVALWPTGLIPDRYSERV